MKAVVCKKYGPPEVLEIVEVDKPTPKDDEVLVKVHATSVSVGEARIRGQNVPPGFGLPMRLALGWSKPRNPRLGAEFAGVVEQVGKAVTAFQIGDEVYGSATAAHAEYLVISAEKSIHHKPNNCTFEEAAAIPFGAHTALQFLKDKGEIQSGHRVLVVGASGSVGTAGVQIAKHFGAHVTGVCSGKNVALVESLGADQVIDYTQKTVTDRPERYDLILETVGALPSKEGKKLLRPNGRFLQVSGGFGDLLRSAFDKQILGGVAASRGEDLPIFNALVESGALKPVVDSTYPLDNIVEAHRRVDTGRKVGNVVVRVPH